MEQLSFEHFSQNLKFTLDHAQRACRTLGERERGRFTKSMAVAVSTIKKKMNGSSKFRESIDVLRSIF